MSNSSVPPIILAPAGLSIPIEADIFAGVQADMNAAFGGNLNPSLSTPQGQIASSTTALIAAKNDLFAKFISQIDPATASGRMQDALGRLYNMSRLPATPTRVQVKCTGLSGVVIPVGALVADVAGNLYACTARGTIPITGNVTLPFDAVVNGPTVCGAGAVSVIYRSIVGLDMVTNEAAGIPGSYVESRADFEYRRAQSVAANAVGSLQSIYAEVFAVPGVTDVYAIQNFTDNPVVNGNITLAPHSIYIAVMNGAGAAIAQAIWKKVSVGCNFNGNTPATILDTSYPPPVPSYVLRYQRPTNTPIYFAVTVQNLSGLTNAALATLIQNTIVSAFGGGDGGQRARIGSTIFASRFFAPIAAVGPMAILNVQLGLTSTPVAASVTMGIDQNPTISAANISVTFA